MANLIPLESLLKHFPHGTPRANQRQALEHIAQYGGNATVEAPTGSGKAALGITILRYRSKERGEGGVYLTPTKNLVQQVEAQYPGIQRMLGRSEYECLYYTRSLGVAGVTAEESPCYLLPCPHRVHQETGRTLEDGVEPCPYFQAKFETLQRIEAGGTAVCTTAFFLQNRLLVPRWREAKIGSVVVDEAHGIAKIARSLFEYTMTDWHLHRVADLVETIDTVVAKQLREFVKAFQRIARARERESNIPHLLADEEIERLILRLRDIDADALENKVRGAIASGALDQQKDRQDLKLLQTLTRTIPQMVRGLEYAIETEEHRPLNLVVAFYYREDDTEFTETQKRARFRLTIRSYHVAPLIRKALGPTVVAYSATIDDPEVFRFETGIGMPFISVGSDFPATNTRIYIPTDTPDMGRRLIADEAQHRRRVVRPTLKRIAASVKRFAGAGHRSLVIVNSEKERQLFLEVATEQELGVVTYGNGGNGIQAKAALSHFVAGEGDVLVGTSGQYAEGLDLRDRLAPIIFFLRPSFPPPTDPVAQFETRRFGSRGKGGKRMNPWRLWNWRAAIEAQQVRGRNIRSETDRGVCFFISQQFRQFAIGRLPAWLQPAYRGNLSMEMAEQDALNLLQR